jgi:uncharacterized phage-associated protein
MINSICKKGTQAINYFARKKEGKINKMKAIKLIYFADRYHLRKYGRPVIGDIYWAMKFGPVASTVLDIAGLQKNIDEGCLDYAKTYLRHPEGDDKGETMVSKKEVDLQEFSQTDIEAMEVAYKEFGDKDQFELAEITHVYPEWSKYEKDILVDGKKRMKMDYFDFFLNPKKGGSGIFDMSSEDIDDAKEIYEENATVERMLG